MADSHLFVLIGCPPGVELSRGPIQECEYIGRVLAAFEQVPDREYITMRADQWDEENAE